MTTYYKNKEFPAQNKGFWGRIKDMWDLLRIRYMLGLFRNCPYDNSSSWLRTQDKQEIKWGTFQMYLFEKTYFIQDWRYEFLQRVCPYTYSKIKSSHYKKMCEKRVAKIKRYIEKATKLKLLVPLHDSPNTSDFDSRLILSLDGIDFLDNLTDFLKVTLKEYGLVISFLIGLIPPTVIWLVTNLPRLLVENNIIGI